MINFYYYSTTFLIVLFLVGICLFATQSIYVCKIVSRERLKRLKRLIGESILLVYYATAAMISVVVIVNRRYGVIDVYTVDKMMCIIGIIAFVYFSYRLIQNKEHIFTIVGITLLNPLFDYGYYEFTFSIGIVLMWIRSLWLLKVLDEYQSTRLSAFSIKEGLDTLPAGVMFCDENGYVYVINRKMKDLVNKYKLEYPYHGNKFWEHLKICNVDGIEVQLLQEDYLLKAQSEAWRFSKRDFKINNTNYCEIIAINVTEVTGALFELENEKVVLENQSEHIKALQENMRKLKREKEYMRIRMQVHDVLSQRLTAIQRMSQTAELMDYESLLSLCKDAISSIKRKQGNDAQALFKEMKDYFNKIGLTIELKGESIKETDLAFIFISVLTEACTNSIKHAQASKVFVNITCDKDGYKIEITNNGGRPTQGIKEGSGLRGIRNRIEDAQGILKVEVMPEFALIIYLPKKEEE